MSEARFELVRELGRGGFGTVYEAIERGLQGSPAVALKLLRQKEADRLYLFKREFRALAELRHKNLVQLYELVASGPEVYFTMELVKGESPLKWLRERPEAARDLLRQLAEGLQALHRAGKLHRDVKPSNILVEAGGRVVLLDFGLAIELDAPEIRGRAGTPLYMSPEECAERPLEPASDWYAVGAVLFEALTGRPPIQGSADELRRRKQLEDAPRARAIAPEVPEDLDELCAQLLARDPSARPSGEEILRRLQVPASLPPPRREPFVGRAREKAELLRRFEESTESGRTAVLLRGPSGIGKSALLRCFLEELERRTPAPMILSGRCFELESVPYKAFDAIVDDLSRQLRRLPPPQAAALLPRDANALATLFPVLRQVEAFAQQSARRTDDAAEVRARGVSALRELFARLGDRHAVVVCIDDLQWGDADSAALFTELMRAPDAPPIFWLLSFREEEAATSPLISRLTQTTLAEVPVHDLRLTGLASDEAAQLAATLLPNGSAAQTQAIAAESEGNPFFVRELARAGEGVHALSGLVRGRVAQLKGAARRVLEAVAVAAQPIELEVVASSSDARSELRDALAGLRAEHLIRAREGQSEKLIECYHDRIREAVVAGLAPEQLKRIHLALAAALETQGTTDAAQIGRHLAEGGDLEHAEGNFLRAAERAAAALAFEEAAQLYRRALALAPLISAPRDRLAIELAHAEMLSAAGHGQEAARLWLQLIERVPPEKRADLRRRATEELLLAGLVEEGYANIQALLAELNLSVPRSTAGALARIVISRLGQALVGLKLRQRSQPASPRELMRVDTLGSLAWSVVQLEPLTGYALQTQHLRLALRSGDPQRAAVALLLEAPVGALKGGRGTGYTRRVLEVAREVIARLDESQMPAAVSRTVEGIVALFEGRWLDGLSHLDAAESAPNISPIRHSSMRGSIYSMRAMNLFWMGRSGDLLRALPRQISDLEAHGNLYGWLWLKLLEAWALSCSGSIEQAWATSELVRARLPAGVFELHRWYLEFGQVKFLLLEGKSQEAWQQLEEVTRRTRFAMLGQSQRVSGVWVRANVALACAADSPAARPKMLAESRKLARRLEREGVPWVDALAKTVRASIAITAGESDEALRLLEEAEPLLEQHHLESVLAIARLYRGRRIGGEAGRAAIAHGEKWLADQRAHPSLGRVVLAGAWDSISAPVAARP